MKREARKRLVVEDSFINVFQHFRCISRTRHLCTHRARYVLVLVNDLRQVEIMVDDGVPDSDDDDTTTQYEVEASDLGPVTAEARMFDTNSAVDGGCDPVGCTADKTRVRRTLQPSLDWRAISRQSNLRVKM